MLQRTFYGELQRWQKKRIRRPLILRGARQVGKTFGIKTFAEHTYPENWLHINFEKELSMRALFSSPDARAIYQELCSIKKMRPSFLFLDEIQACPQAIATLRYFHEDLPNIDVMAAGSLLDFSLEDHKYSMPVGRVEFLHIYPLSFEEFLLALGHREFVEHILALGRGKIYGEGVHQELLKLFTMYLFVGGMPQAVQAYVDTQDLLEIKQIHAALLLAFEADFSKYSGRFKTEALRKVYEKIPQVFCKKLKYTEIDTETRSGDLKQAVKVLSQARLLHYIFCTKAQGLPLGADLRGFYKLVFADVGLLNHMLQIELSALKKLWDNYQGRLAEQFVGQELVSSGPTYEDRALYYWEREERNSSAEVDFLITFQNKIIPVEVKSGPATKLKSTHIFLKEKNLDLAVLLNTDAPQKNRIRSKQRTRVLSEKKTDAILDYTLIHLPVYAAGFLTRILSQLGP